MSGRIFVRNYKKLLLQNTSRDVIALVGYKKRYGPKVFALRPTKKVFNYLLENLKAYNIY